MRIASAVLITGPGLVLIPAAFAHLRHLSRFRAVLVAQALIRFRWTRNVAVLVGCTELVCGTLGVWAGASVGVGGGAPLVLAAPSCGLLLSFSGYLLILLRSGRAVPCGCFGGTSVIRPATAARALALGASVILGMCSAVWTG